MIRLSGLKLPLDHPAEAMPAAICQRLELEPHELRGHSLVRRGNDARRRNAIQPISNWMEIIDNKKSWT